MGKNKKNKDINIILTKCINPLIKLYKLNPVVKSKEKN